MQPLIQDVGTLCALITAAVLFWAAVVKLRTPVSTAAALSALGLPGLPGFSSAGDSHRAVARVLPLAEICVAVAILSVPQFGSGVAVALLLAFSVVVARVLVTKPGESIRCGCFGASSAAISSATLLRNVLLIGCALAPVFVAGTVRSVPSFASVVTVTAGIVISTVAVQLLTLRSEIGSVWSVRRSAERIAKKSVGVGVGVAQ
jgi:Methylamine utilisation protein MauE